MVRQGTRYEILTVSHLYRVTGLHDSSPIIPRVFEIWNFWECRVGYNILQCSMSWTFFGKNVPSMRKHQRPKILKQFGFQSEKTFQRIYWTFQVAVVDSWMEILSQKILDSINTGDRAVSEVPILNTCCGIRKNSWSLEPEWRQPILVTCGIFLTTIWTNRPTWLCYARLSLWGSKFACC